MTTELGNQSMSKQGARFNLKKKKNEEKAKGLMMRA